MTRFVDNNWLWRGILVLVAIGTSIAISLALNETNVRAKSICAAVVQSAGDQAQVLIDFAVNQARVSHRPEAYIRHTEQIGVLFVAAAKRQAESRCRPAIK